MSSLQRSQVARDGSKTATRPLLVLAPALLAVCFVVRWPTFLPSSIDHDESVYLLMADAWYKGVLPYISVWDHKPIGVYAIFELALTVFGRSVVAVRVAATLFTFASSLLLYGLALQLLRDRRVATLAALLYPAFSILWGGTAANSEHFFIAPSLGGALLLATIATGALQGAARWWRLCAAGLVFGVALQIKYIAAFEIAYFVPLYMCSQWSARRARVFGEALALAALGLAPTLLAGAYFWVHGELDAFIDSNFLANLRHAGSSGADGGPRAFVDSMKSWTVATTPLWAFAGACWLQRHLRKERPSIRLEHWLLLGWVAVGLFEASATQQFYRHYYLVTLPPLCLLASEAARDGALLARRSFAPWALALVLSSFPLLAITSKYYARWVTQWRSGPDTPAQIADFVRSRIAPGESLFVLDYETVVYFLADAPAATRYAFPPFLLDPHFSAVARVDHREEFARILGRQPRCIVMRATSFARAETFREMIGSEYRLQDTFDDVEVRCRD